MVLRKHEPNFEPLLPSILQRLRQDHLGNLKKLYGSDYL